MTLDERIAQTEAALDHAKKQVQAGQAHVTKWAAETYAYQGQLHLLQTMKQEASETAKALKEMDKRSKKDKARNEEQPE